MVTPEEELIGAMQVLGVRKREVAGIAGFSPLPPRLNGPPPPPKGSLRCHVQRLQNFQPP
jgi:hypothetical protein